MPIYEYRCGACGKVSTFFVRGFSTPLDAVCSHCNSGDMSRLISRVSIVKSAAQRLDELDNDRERQVLGRLSDPFDAADIAHWSKAVGEDSGSELDINFKEMAEQVTGENRPFDLYDPIGAYSLAVERKRRELMKQLGIPVPEPRTITDEILESTPYQAPEFVEEAGAGSGPPKAPWESESSGG